MTRDGRDEIWPPEVVVGPELIAAHAAAARHLRLQAIHATLMAASRFILSLQPRRAG